MDKAERERAKALQTKRDLEEIWKHERLRSPFFKALWTTTRDGKVAARATKEKIPDEELTG